MAGVFTFNSLLSKLLSKVNSHELFPTRGRFVKIMSKTINITNEQSLEKALTFGKKENYSHKDLL